MKYSSLLTPSQSTFKGIIYVSLSLILLTAFNTKSYSEISESPNVPPSISSTPAISKASTAERSYKKLADCPSTPNCVSSQMPADDKHYITPLALVNNDGSESQEQLIRILSKTKRVKIQTQQERYIKAIFTSRFMSYIDDVEFSITDSHIDVRSASREGHYDIGANRKRIEKIRKQLAK